MSRNQNTRAAQTKIASSIPKEDTKVHAADPSAFERAHARFAEAQADLLKFFNAPGWKRTLVATVTWFGIIALGSVALSAIVEGLVVAAAIGSTGVFLTLCTAALALFIGAKVTASFATRVAGAILTKEADERAIAAYDAVRKFTIRINPFASKA